MGNIGWIKLSTRIFDDEKIQIIEKMPEGHAILLAWIKLLVLGAQGNGDGTIRLSETLPYTDEMLSVIWRLPVNIVRLALQTFEGFGMVELHSDKTIEIIHWGTYQEVGELERIRTQGRERARRFRERKAIENAADDTIDTRNKTRLDKNRIDSNVTGNVTYPTAFEKLWAAYPRKTGKTAAFRKWKATLKKGANEETLFQVVKRYSNECRAEDRDQRYIKLGSTFFGPDEHWREYMSGGAVNTETAEEVAAAQFGRA